MKGKTIIIGHAGIGAQVERHITEFQRGIVITNAPSPMVLTAPKKMPDIISVAQPTRRGTNRKPQVK